MTSCTARAVIHVRSSASLSRAGHGRPPVVRLRAELKPAKRLWYGLVPSSSSPKPTRVASLLDTESERSYRDFRPGTLLEMRIIPEMRVGRAAHDARPPGVESAEVALRDRGFRLTAPRHAVLEVVRGIKTHPTAEEVHRLVIRRAPGV